MRDQRHAELAPWLLNLIAPGAGLILAGNLAHGLIAGAVFLTVSNLAVWAWLIIPDESAQSGRWLLLGITAIVYVAAQVLHAQTMRRRSGLQAELIRRDALALTCRRLEAGDPGGALAALQPLLPGADSDLLIAYRAAQVLTALGDAERARRAWRRLRQLDKHHVYRRQIEEGLLAVDGMAERA